MESPDGQLFKPFNPPKRENTDGGAEIFGEPTEKKRKVINILDDDSDEGVMDEEDQLEMAKRWFFDMKYPDYKYLLIAKQPSR